MWDRLAESLDTYFDEDLNEQLKAVNGEDSLIKYYNGEKWKLNRGEIIWILAVQFFFGTVK